jgi:hypothetical protein
MFCCHALHNNAVQSTQETNTTHCYAMLLTLHDTAVQVILGRHQELLQSQRGLPAGPDRQPRWTRQAKQEVLRPPCVGAQSRGDYGSTRQEGL